MFDFSILDSLFSFFLFCVVMCGAIYVNNYYTAVSIFAHISPILFFLAYCLYCLVDNNTATNITPFNLYLPFDELMPSIRQGLNVSLDHSTLGFNAFLLSGLITCFIFLILSGAKPYSISINSTISLAIILFSGFLLISTESLVLLFISFELLLLSSIYLLRLTSKSERVVEASIEMFFWTLVGSLALILAFTWLYASGVYSFIDLQHSTSLKSLPLMLFIVGFGVKIPVWPFFSWLLKAHVEASVEFSILLSGFIVKAGVWGLYRMLSLSSSYSTMLILITFSLMGIIVASFRILAQRDLKRIVALTTVIEMNWLSLCLALGNATFDKIAIYIVATHSVITSLEFLVVESVSKRFNSRDLTQISGLVYSMPLLTTVAFYTTLVTIGFPGTPLFFAKMAFFSALLNVNTTILLTLLFVLLLMVPLTFMRIWVPVWFGLHKTTLHATVDLSTSEQTIFGVLILLSLIMAWCPAILINF